MGLLFLLIDLEKALGTVHIRDGTGPKTTGLGPKNQLKSPDGPKPEPGKARENKYLKKFRKLNSFPNICVISFILSNY